MKISYSPKTSLAGLINISIAFLFITVNAQQNIDKNNLAVSGYDLVEYFDGNANSGSVSFQVNYKGAVYRFINQFNKDTFKKNPEVYLPQFGGWCAYAMGYNGKKVEINPESFSIENNKLYLFYKTTFTDTKKKWSKNNQELKAKANQNWNRIINQ